jgi:hypothetical protein
LEDVHLIHAQPHKAEHGTIQGLGNVDPVTRDDLAHIDIPPRGPVNTATSGLRSPRMMVEYQFCVKTRPDLHLSSNQAMTPGDNDQTSKTSTA